MKKYVIGVDVGGTACKLGVFETTGELLTKWEIKTDTRDKGSHILEDVAKAVLGKIGEMGIAAQDVLGIGVGVPSPVTGDGIAVGAANLGWSKYPVAQVLNQLTGLPVKAGNDVNVATLGEQWMGSAVGRSSALMLTLGTGVGGGVVIDNRIVTGFSGAAGEIGHMKVKDNETIPCGCGKYGCLEQYASATGIVRLAKELLCRSDEASAMRQCENLTAKDVFDCAKAQDALALQVVDQFGQILGTALANIAAIINPEIFVIGGGVSKAGQIILDVVQKYFRENVFFGCADTQFTLASLGNDAGIYGAASMVLN